VRSLSGADADVQTQEAGIVLADRIPLSSRMVLALGCGDGAFAAELRRRNPACTVVGIERDPGLAREAARVMHQAYCLDIEWGPLPRLPAAPDCILLGPGLLGATRDPTATLAEFAAMLAPGGVVVACAPDEPGRFGPDSFGPAIERAGLHLVDMDEGAWAGPGVRWVYRATRGAVARFSVASTMLPPVGGVSQVRVVEPQRALATLPGVSTRIANRVADVPNLGDPPGVFILHRPALLGAQGLGIVRQLIDQGWLVVCEFDDHPSQIPILYRSDVQNFRAVHAIQTSTPLLAEIFRAENPEVAVFPNAVSRLPDPQNFADPQRLTMLFAALNREHDWHGHIGAIDAAAQAAGGRLHVHVIADRGFFDALATPHKAFTPLCDYATYLDILAGCEISFMPLRDTLFNRCKSDLKFLEAAAHRAVALASPVVYGQSIDDGRNGLLFDSPAMLRTHLMRLAAAPHEARALAERAREGVGRSRMLAYQVADRLEWYRGLWARREELHRALLDRMPELAA